VNQQFDNSRAHRFVEAATMLVLCSGIDSHLKLAQATRGEDLAFTV
jgi:hypothetical protein